MDKKIGDVARGLLVVLAIAAAFATIPYAAAALLVIGGISAISNTPEDNTRVLLIAIVLGVGAKALDAIPSVGSYLSAIFSGLGTAAIGASVVGITVGLARRIKADWTAA